MTAAECLTRVTVAQRAAEAAMAGVIEYLLTASAPTSEAAHAVIDEVLARHQCTSPEGHIVASGTASAEPHEVGSGPIARGVPIVIDIFPRSEITGCYGDITRTVCLGAPPSELIAMYDAVQGAYAAVMPYLRPGQDARAIQQVADEYFAAQGFVTSGEGTVFTFAEGFVHALGHGLGAALHGHPRISRKTTDRLAVGDIITIEPGLYYRHLGGVRHEDVVVITESGYELVTHFPTTLQLTA